MNSFDIVFGGGLLLFVIVILGSIIAWCTHVIKCISTEKYIFLIAGAICVPVGIIHGIGVWFGFWDK